MSSEVPLATDASPGPARRPRGAAGSTAIFAVWTAVSRVVGFVREIVASILFGTSGQASAFTIAFNAPNLLRSLVADSALSAAFVPAFTRLQEQGRHADARRLAGALAGFVTLALSAVTIVAVLAAPWIMPLFAPGLDADFRDELVLLSQIMFPIVVLLALTGLVMAIQQAAGQFVASAFVPVLWNLVIIASLVWSTIALPEHERIYAYAAGIVLGTLGQLLYLLPKLRGLGPFPLSSGLRNPEVHRVLRLMLPVTVGLGLINVSATIGFWFASLVDDGGPRALEAAFRLYILPQGIFSVAISTVLFPAISRQAAKGEHRAMRVTIVDGLRQIFFLLLPATAFLMVLAEPIVRVLYEYGKWSAESTAITSEALLFYAIGLVFNGASLLLIRAFFSLQKATIATKVALGGVIVNTILDAALYRPMGIGGIALATSITSLVTFLALAWLLAGELGGLRGRSVVGGFIGACGGCGGYGARRVGHLVGRRPAPRPERDRPDPGGRPRRRPRRARTLRGRPCTGPPGTQDPGKAPRPATMSGPWTNP